MTYVKGKWLWLGVATPLLILTLLCAACGSEDGPLPTGSSSFQANPDSSSALQLGRLADPVTTTAVTTMARRTLVFVGSCSNSVIAKL